MIISDNNNNNNDNNNNSSNYNISYHYYHYHYQQQYYHYHHHHINSVLTQVLITHINLTFNSPTTLVTVFKIVSMKTSTQRFIIQNQVRYLQPYSLYLKQLLCHTVFHLLPGETFQTFVIIKIISTPRKNVYMSTGLNFCYSN